MADNQYSKPSNEYDELFTQTYLGSKLYQTFSVELDDETLQKMLIRDLDENVSFWNKKPWVLQKTDIENVKYFIGDQLNDNTKLQPQQGKYVDNRMFSSMRAILSYATNQLAVPEIIPSKGDDRFKKMAAGIQRALYQHSKQERVQQKVRAAVMNLLVRKRAYLKMRFDPSIGIYGDVVTEVCNPEDIIIDRYAKYMQNPNKIYHRLRATVEELCIKYPKKADKIKAAFQIKQNRWTQRNRQVSYYECWYTYYSKDGTPLEGVCTFIPEYNLVLENMPNPNWVYMNGDNYKEKQTNVTPRPPKPFINFNFINFGNSYIDETSVFEQAKILQDILNTRGQQFNDNISYMNGRWIMSKKAVSDADASKFVNRGSKTVLLVNSEDVGRAAQVMAPPMMPNQVYESIQDVRNEIDGLMGTPSVFKGANPSGQDTLGRDMMLKQQAGMLQDDLVRSVQTAMEDYYTLKLQMFRVYYTDDYWFQVKGSDGKFDFIMLNGDSIDSNVKIGVQVDSTLPLDKANIRYTAMELAKMNKIDPLTLMEDLGLPDPEARVERLIRSQMDPYTYMESMEQKMDNNEASIDIDMLIAGKVPEERDNYDQKYLEYYNHFVTTNRFTTLKPQQQQAVISYLQIVTLKAQRSAALNETMLNPAGIINRPPIFPLPKRTMNIRLNGAMSPQQTQQIASSEGQMFTPVQQAVDAQSPNQGSAPSAPAQQAAAAPPQPM